MGAAGAITAASAEGLLLILLALVWTKLHPVLQVSGVGIAMLILLAILWVLSEDVRCRC